MIGEKQKEIKMKTYRKVLLNGMKRNVLLEVDGEETVEVLNIDVSKFICSLCGIFVYQASKQINKDDFSVSELVDVFGGNDFEQNAVLHSHVTRFLAWLLNQEIKPDDYFWDSIDSLGEKWNEFAKIDREMRKEGVRK